MVFHVEIRELEERNSHKWDALLERSPQGTPFHRFDWLKIMDKYTNTKLLLLVGLDGQEIFAAIPLFIQKPFKGLIRRVFSPPYPTQVPYLGPVFYKYNEWKESLRESRLRVFQQELDNYIRSKIRAHVTLILTSPGLIDARPYLITGYNVSPKFTYNCNISEKEKVWKQFRRNLRKSIVKTENRGIQIKEGGLEEFNFIIELLRARLKEKEKRLEVPNDYFLEIYHKFYPDNLKIFVSEYNGENISGQILLIYKNKIWAWMGLPRTNLKGIYPNDLIRWKTIEWASNKGYRFFEIIDAQTSTSFKAKYNFNLDVYYSIKKCTRKYNLVASSYRFITKSCAF